MDAAILGERLSQPRLLDMLWQILDHQGANWIKVNLHLRLGSLVGLLPDAMVLNLDVSHGEAELGVVAVAESDDGLASRLKHLDAAELLVELLVVVTEVFLLDAFHVGGFIIDPSPSYRNLIIERLTVFNLLAGSLCQNLIPVEGVRLVTVALEVEHCGVGVLARLEPNKPIAFACSCHWVLRDLAASDGTILGEVGLELLVHHLRIEALDHQVAVLLRVVRLRSPISNTFVGQIGSVIEHS